MRYYYEKPEVWSVCSAKVITSNHPMYNKCTLYFRGDKGIAVVQKRYNAQTKMFWWGPIDPWLVDDISSQDDWPNWFEKNADVPDENGIFPSFTVRKVMWAMRMKPLPREAYEKSRKIQGL